jgi:putative ABC transport system ATP-binding protein
MHVIEADTVSKTYRANGVPVEALRAVSFRIAPGAFVSFVGPSGSGKTTLLNLIGCLDKPTSGRLAVAGVDVSGLGRRPAAAFRGQHLGFIFQDFNLIPVLTAYENVEYPLLLVQRAAAAERRSRVMSLLEAVGMGEHRDRYPDELSGGQKQRLAVARALVTRPTVVLADEPTANLDHATAAGVLATMKRMRDELGTTFIFSTHDPRVVGEAEIVHTLEDGVLASSRMAAPGV